LLGVFANVVELIATLEKTPSCDLELEAEYNLNIGAFAKLSVSVDLFVNLPKYSNEGHAAKIGI